jgi:hypothetical protein
MWRKVRPIVLAVSIALNLALLSTWAVHAVPAHLAGGRSPGGGEGQQIWCPLHRELGVSREQWQKLGRVSVRGPDGEIENSRRS